VRIGRVGVFSGHWLSRYADDGPDGLRMGFVGTLIERFPDHEDHLCTEVSNAGRTSLSSRDAETSSRGLT
jgi:hypothetical protein